MIDLFKPFKAFLKFKYVCTDNNVFRMHYKVTVIMLLIFTLMVTSKQFFGEPIHCIGDSSDNIDAINNYCWIYGTYTLKSELPGEIRKQVYPGVGPSKVDGDQIKHTYYQWVCFVLLGQAVMFYTPRYLWKIWEGGRLKALASDLASPMVTKAWSKNRRGELVSYLNDSNMYAHNLYALRYAFCEILNLINVIGQIFLLDIFLGGEFRSYGKAVATFTHKPALSDIIFGTDPVPTDINPMDKFFPKITKCFFKKFGSSGSREFRDYICILPLNIVNEKIFVILWFWLISLVFFSICAVLFRILVLSMPPLRTMMIMGQIRCVKRNVVSKIVKNFGFGDWFILYYLGKNMNPLVFKELVLEIYKSLEPKTVITV